MFEYRLEKKIFGASNEKVTRIFIPITREVAREIAKNAGLTLRNFKLGDRLVDKGIENGNKYVVFMSKVHFCD